MPIGSIAVLTGKTAAVILKSYLGKDEGQAQRDAVKYDFAMMAVNEQMRWNPNKTRSTGHR